ncbi:MAG: hypothetical protein AVDCRST_MAG01-01-2880, partial [uncultured Rubrobacteraceae bacterium]
DVPSRRRVPRGLCLLRGRRDDRRSGRHHRRAGTPLPSRSRPAASRGALRRHGRLVHGIRRPAPGAGRPRQRGGTDLATLAHARPCGGWKRRGDHPRKVPRGL